MDHINGTYINVDKIYAHPCSCNINKLAIFDVWDSLAILIWDIKYTMRKNPLKQLAAIKNCHVSQRPQNKTFPTIQSI